MIRFSENQSLKNYNTFHTDATASYFFEFTEPEDLQTFLQANKSWVNENLLLIGQGSNILFVNDFDGLVIHHNIPGIRKVFEDRNYEWLEVGAGEIWDEFVQYAVAYGLGGIENLSLIPGTVGAAPVQNIGAYGQEVCNVIQKIKGFDLQKNEFSEYDVNECRFDYRNSIFKSYLKNKFIITSVIFKLNKFPEFNLNYGQLEEKVNQKGVQNVLTVREAVVEIRRSKLPEISDLGNAGSFFKNPVVDNHVAEKLKAKYENIPVYPASNGFKKIAAGWLIEQAGWKGYREGDAGVHKNQALVLVNHGNATGKEIFQLSEKIRKSVLEQFQIDLEREVNCI